MARSKEQEGESGTRRLRHLEEVVDAFETPLLRYTTRLLNNATLAQDVVQNVFIKLFRQWPAGQQADPRLRSWLYRVAHNEAVDLIRGEERRKRLHERHAAEISTCTDGVHCDARPDERVATVLRALAVLDLPERQVVLLRLQQGLTYEEIADVTGKSSGYVGSLLHHAVRKLAQAVRQEECA